MATVASSAEFVPATQLELARFMADNSAGPRKSVCPVGGRTALHYGAATRADVAVVMSELKRIVDYPARDMTITVEAGTRIDDLQAKLAAEGQRLPIDIAQHGRATLGGALATNTSGPRRFGHGTFRDYVIGISAVDAGGRLFKAGGRVVKNVAGYDTCKLLVGSRGTLGIVTQVTLKLRPVAESTALLWAQFADFESIERSLNRLLLSDTRPVAVEVLNAAAAKTIGVSIRLPANPGASVLCIGIEGSVAETDWQIDALRREIGEFGFLSADRVDGSDAIRLWDAMTEFPVCADDPLTFQANLLPSKCIAFVDRATKLGIAVQSHAGNGVVIGQLPDEAATLDRTMAILNELRELAHGAHGNLVILHCDPEWQSRMPMCGKPKPIWAQMQRLKRQLDPLGLLNPGLFIDAPTVP